MQVTDVTLAFVAAGVVFLNLFDKEERELQVYLQCALQADISVPASGVPISTEEQQPLHSSPFYHLSGCRNS